MSSCDWRKISQNQTCHELKLMHGEQVLVHGSILFHMFAEQGLAIVHGCSGGGTSLNQWPLMS